ncbi:conserved protein of unknown function (plasmid) [Rhodovastum atsumiense]|uniref:hypothetical protein n=1 Tax=Rhodovastum atsumiense TaxID=504468 RepID=UPI002025487B|nr:hypothetical protein [Rhodovastum atsumiense]CAH2605463.1 conserved protein of unknown function [Rhodovastum atsumiense]
MTLRIVRAETGEVTLIDETDGRELLDLVPLGVTGEELTVLLTRIEMALGLTSLPRIAVGYREGLIEAVHADISCEVVLIEEDPFDEPEVTLRRREVMGDPHATATAIARGEERARRRN